ncbi:uncharacterized protein LOC111299837 [Durio zibethinus]|uniref:Uncharacterized protein LOC111299837 n=1 Tax=Durio zibethinus TaxID=66656 RepID=A0A6P5ZEW3_DURZI|nr:uncharacterized protein LOC111299837 [Durio zibethinus]
MTWNRLSVLRRLVSSHICSTFLRENQEMGNGYNHHLHHQNLQLNHKGTFLPKLCSKPSIKDVTVPTWHDRSASFSDDPLSPKISCMGQVKRNNRIVGFPASHNITTRNSCNNSSIKYFKLKKLFSGKNLASSPATTITNTTTSGRRKEVLVNGTSRPKNGDGKENSASINIENMDPPLPVIKRVPKQGDKGNGDTLWQRRSGGVTLKSLQLQQIQPSKHQEPTTF